MWAIERGPRGNHTRTCWPLLNLDGGGMVQPQGLDDLIEGPVAAISQVGGRDEVPGTAVCVCVYICTGVCEWNILDVGLSFGEGICVYILTGWRWP
jgi:hypothetical protein